MADIAALADELSNDPLGRGYSTMTDQEAADDLNTDYRQFERSALSGSSIFNAIDPSEFATLTDQQKQFVRDVFSLGDAVDVSSGTNARAVLLDAFGAGTTTRSNLVALVQYTISRAVELDLLGRSESIGPAHVAEARA